MNVPPNKTMCAGLPSRPLILLYSIFDLQDSRTQLEILLETHEVSMIVVGILTALAFALRFYKINHPDQVVFVQPRIHSSTHNLTLSLS